MPKMGLVGRSMRKTKSCRIGARPFGEFRTVLLILFPLWDKANSALETHPLTSPKSPLKKGFLFEIVSNFTFSLARDCRKKVYFLDV